MGLVTVFFQIEGKPARAIVDEENVEFFLQLGATWPTTVEVNVKAKAREPVKEEVPVEKLKSDGDLGSGPPGSLKFHELTVQELKTFESIRDYTQRVTGRVLRKNRNYSIEKYREIACSLIKEKMNGS